MPRPRSGFAGFGEGGHAHLHSVGECRNEDRAAHRKSSHEIRSTVVGPRWSASHTNQAYATAVVTFGPVQPCRCIAGTRFLRKTRTRASRPFSRIGVRRVDSRNESRSSITTRGHSLSAWAANSVASA